MRLRKATYLFSLLSLMVVLGACSTKRNTTLSRFWQAFTTRYNVYYNGSSHYNEQIKELEDKYEDDYSQQLYIHPAEAYQNPKAPQPATNFDRTIEKMQKAIALHSIKKKPKRKPGKGSDEKYNQWLKRDEFNPFIHNAWIMLAKAQYMKGDFLSAASTFHYITRHFTWKPDLVLQAKLWEALSYCAMGWTTEADNILAHIHLEQIEDKDTRALAQLAFADYYIKEKQLSAAIPHLRGAIRGAKGQQKVRLNFLLGQLYEGTNRLDSAYIAYKAAGSNRGSSYRTQFNARLRRSAVYHGDNPLGEIKSLRSLTRYDRNKPYLDQIYYAIGNLYMQRADTTEAIAAYKRGRDESTRNGIEKALVQLALGQLYFDRRRYDLAQPEYAAAVPLLSEDYPNYKVLKLRSDVLDQLAVYAQNVTLQDSLLTLAKMPLAEQKKVVAKIIEDLKKKEKEEQENAQRQEYLAQQQAKGNPNMGGKNNAQQPTTFSLNNDKSWYFYNTATVAAGKTAFQQLWGNRKLEDSWRRRNKNTFSMSDIGADAEGGTTSGDGTRASGDSTAVDKKVLERENDPHYEEYYLKQIPSTPEQIQTAHDIIQEGLYNMGVILKDQLEDFSASAYQFGELLRRYPDNQYRLDTYYNLYLLYMRDHKPDMAERYRQRIVNDFAESDYGKAMADPNYLENLRTMEQQQELLYEQAYRDYLSNNNQAVHQALATMQQRYPLSKLMPKFMFLDALCYVTEGQSKRFSEALKVLLERYPQTELTDPASSMLKQLNQGRKLNGTGSNIRALYWATRLGGDSANVSAPTDTAKFVSFQAGRNRPQYFVLLFSTDSINANQLLYMVAKHNFSRFTLRDFELESLNYGSLGLLIVKTFANYADVAHYRTVLEQDSQLRLPREIHPVIISKENFELLLREGRSFQEYFRFMDQQNDRAVERQIPDLNKEQKPAVVAEPELAKQPENQEPPIANPELVISTPHTPAVEQPKNVTIEPESEVVADSVPVVEAEPTLKQAVTNDKQLRKERERQIEQERKAKEKADREREKQRKAEAKAREKERKERAKQAEKERREREKQRKQLQKQREQERKQRTKEAEQKRKEREKQRQKSQSRRR